MAKLPNAENAIIDAEKLQDYVLSSSHPIGRFKAAFFRQMGYSAGDWQMFELHLRQQILTREVIKVEETHHGQKFVIEGPMTGPAGKTMQIVTVWVILKGAGIPRFVTAYPGGL
ncbi:MAG: hypothetical protein Q8O05_02905 [Chloroflexota bacterium]|nr:hypothetical protein [Chloroflexota bacterium]